MGVEADRRRLLLTAMRGLLAVPAAVYFHKLTEAQPPLSSAQADKHPSRSAHPFVSLNARDYGASGNGAVRDTLPIQFAIERCAAFGGGEVRLPAGTYLSGRLTLRSNVTLHVEEGATLLGSSSLADYPLTQVRWEGKWIDGYSAFITAQDARNIRITGPGRIIGSSAILGRLERGTRYRLPALMEFVRCSGVRVDNCFTKNYGMWSIHPTDCDNVIFANLQVESGADGIDVDSCRHVVIDHCDFHTTDDCISLKSGRGEEGYSIGLPTEDVHISNCSFHDVHWACIGVGSETSGGIRNVWVDHCKCLGARTFAIYIKTRIGRGAFIENIFMHDLEVSGAKQGFLRLNFLNSGRQDESPVPGVAGIPTVRNLRFSNVRVSDVPVLVDGTAIDPQRPLDGLVLSNISGTCGKGISLANVKRAEIRKIRVSGFSGSLLNTSNVSGSGLAGAVPIDATTLPQAPPSVPQPEPAYKLR